MPQDSSAKSKNHKQDDLIFWSKKTAITVVAGFSLASALIAGGGMLVYQSQNIKEVNLAGQTVGAVALTESELRDTVIREKITAYWTGPEENSLYTLVANANQQVFVRYLPNGQGLADTTPAYRVIATYPQSDAFMVTKTAGNQPNAMSFVNGDGAQVFYSKDLAENVYVAFPNAPYSIEVFDPKTGGSLTLATTPGAITLIK